MTPVPTTPLATACLGLVVPSSNTVVEPVAAAAAREHGMAVVASRVRVTHIARTAEADRQFSVDAMTRAASLLADAGPAAVAWAGTSGAWLGLEADDAVRQALSATCHVPAVTSTSAMLDACAHVGAHRVALVTPYTDAVVARICRTLADVGVDVVTEAHLGLSDNASFARVPTASVADLVARCLADRPDAEAAVVHCTNLRGAPLGGVGRGPSPSVPVLDSVLVTLWALLRACGRDVGIDAMPPSREEASCAW